jgi:hypothetical protein
MIDFDNRLYLRLNRISNTEIGMRFSASLQLLQGPADGHRLCCRPKLASKAA